MLTVGLTGGIGSGKSTVATMFRSEGVPAFDADEIARDLLAPGSALTKRVCEQFPDCVDRPDAVDRRKLARRVFSDPIARARLEALLHPAIWQAYLALTDEQPDPHPFCIFEGAVLLESSTRFPLAGLIVVTAPVDVRRERLRARGDLDDEQIQARVAAQLPDHEKILRASHVIDNAGLLHKTQEQVKLVMEILSLEHGGRA